MRRMLERAKAASWIKEIIVERIPRGGFAHGVTLLAGGAALGQVINLLVSPVITRIYTPEDFGVFGVYSSALGIIIAMAALGFDFAIPIPEDEENAANIMALCFVILLGTTMLSCFAVYCFGSQIVSWANVPGLKNYLWLIPLGMLGGGAYRILNYWAVRKRNFKRIGRTQITRGLARASLQVGLGLAYPGPLGLLLGQFAGESAGSASLGASAWQKDRAPLSAVSLQGMRQAASRYRRFPIFSGTANIIDSLGLNAPQLLFAAFYGPEVAGWFALGQRVIAAPLNIVVDSVSLVYFGEAARLPKDNPQTMRRLFLRLTGRLALAGAIPTVIICALSPWFFAFVFGPVWETAGRYVQILGLMFAIRFAVIPLQHTLNVLERQDLYFSWDSIRLIIVVGALLAARTMDFSHLAAVAAYSLSMSVSYVILWIIAWKGLTREEVRIIRV